MAVNLQCLRLALQPPAHPQGMTQSPVTLRQGCNRGYSVSHYDHVRLHRVELLPAAPCRRSWTRASQRRSATPPGPTSATRPTPGWRRPRPPRKTKPLTVRSAAPGRHCVLAVSPCCALKAAVLRRHFDSALHGSQPACMAVRDDVRMSWPLDSTAESCLLTRRCCALQASPSSRARRRRCTSTSPPRRSRRGCTTRSTAATPPPTPPAPAAAPRAGPSRPPGRTSWTGRRCGCRASCSRCAPRGTCSTR
jgi:hypothetical protein